MKSCEGCYYEDRPPMEACNLCRRDDDGELTGWVPKGEGTPLSVGKADTSPHRGEARPLPVAAAEAEAAATLYVDEDDSSPLRWRQVKRSLPAESCEASDGPAAPNYEAMYEELLPRLEKAQAEAEFYRKQLEWGRHEQKVLEAKLEMVYLIFGGGSNG